MLIIINSYKRKTSFGSKKNDFSFIILSILLFLSITANAQSTLTLSQAIQKGLANKKNLLAGNFDIAISNLQTQALYRKYWPQVSAEYTYMYNPILQTSILPIGVFNPSYPIDATKSVQFGTKWTQSAGITLVQPLLDLSVRRHIEEAKLQEKIAMLVQEQSAYESAYTIAQTYIDIYLEDAKIKSLIADTNRTYVSYTLLKNKFDEKRLLKSDLNKSKVIHNNIVQLLSDGIAQLIEDKVYLLFLMGESDIAKWDFQVDTTFSTKYSVEDEFESLHLEQLPDLQQLQLQSQLTDLQTQSERIKQVPTISFKGYLGANQYANTFNPVAANSWFGSSYVGLDVKIPLLFGENPNNTIAQHQLQAKQYNLQAEDKVLQYPKEVFTAKLNMDNIKTQLQTQSENILLSIESIYIFQARVAEGQESALNLNVEEAGLQVLEANYETNKKQLWVYWLDYVKASGQLSVLWK